MGWDLGFQVWFGKVSDFEFRPRLDAFGLDFQVLLDLGFPDLG